MRRTCWRAASEYSPGHLNWRMISAGIALDILGASGGPFDASGTVEFVAYYRSVPGVPAEERVKGSMHELSRFEKVGGAWFYVDGDVR